MAAEPAPPPVVKISKIAGRYLVFDTEAIAVLRRRHNTNGTLVGTLPQQPTQNLFLGAPIEIRPEEAQALVQRGCARVVDDAAAHRAVLGSGAGDAGRAAYIESLRRKKASAQQVIAEEMAERRAVGAEKISRAKGKKGKEKEPPAPTDDLLFDNDAAATTAPAPAQKQEGNAQASTKQVVDLAVTPTSSKDLIPDAVDRDFEVADVPEAPLARFLQAGGYHMTPGLRFGSRYSVYPGDPLRFHAHFMANQYAWDEPIPVMEIVQGGRLATAVKKAFLVGGEDPSTKEVRTFSIEWASM